ncbi:MAG: hypothetical protein ACI8Y4_001009 [Candidatus Poriferisodalaceae bacterium]|jgi:hypothetical protein
MAAGWRKMYNRWEAAVAPSLEQATASDAFRDIVAVGMQMTRTIRDETEKAGRQWLHMWNLPAAGDVRNLRRQISSLDLEVQSLRRELAGQPSTAPLLKVVEASSKPAGPTAKAKAN